MARRKSSGFKFLGLMFFLLGVKVQKPVRRVKRTRSFKYRLICKLLAGHGRKGGRKGGRKRKVLRTGRGISKGR
ncbi:MAG: hypothetical protein PHQ67_03955 [Fermentimonas sp.]|nr:hypothetical protein [Fermentimonas sp.]